MKTVGLLIKIRLRALIFGSLATNSKKKGKRVSPAMAVLFAFVMLFCFAIFAFIAGMIAAIMLFSLQEAGRDLSFYFAATSFLAFALCIFGSVFTTQTELYGAKDNELLLAMPIKPSAILISRTVMLFIINLFFGGIVILPSYLLYVIFGGGGVVGGLAAFFFYLLIPVVALAISCLLGWLIALVASRIQHKNIITLILSLLFFGAYMFVMMRMDGILEGLELYMSEIITAVSPYLTVFWWIGYAMNGQIVYGLLFTLLCAAIVAVALFFLSRTYIRIITTSRTTAHRTYREKKTKQATPMWALIRKELRHFVGNVNYMMNDGLGLVFAPIVGGVMLYNRPKLQEIASIEELAVFVELLPAMIGGALCFFSSITLISSPSVSLEGKSLWLSQSLPVHPRTVLLAKVYAHVVICTPFYLVTSILGSIAVSAGVLETVGIILLPFAANVFCAYLGVIFNTLFPKFDYVNETEVIKSGMAVFLTMLLAAIASCVVGALVIGATVILLPAGVALLLGTVVFGLGIFGLHMAVRGPLARRFSRL